MFRARVLHLSCVIAVSCGVSNERAELLGYWLRQLDKERAGEPRVASLQAVPLLGLYRERAPTRGEASCPSVKIHGTGCWPWRVPMFWARQESGKGGGVGCYSVCVITSTSVISSGQAPRDHPRKSCHCSKETHGSREGWHPGWQRARHAPPVIHPLFPERSLLNLLHRKQSRPSALYRWW